VPLPNFLLKKTPKQENIRRIRELIGNPCLHTVCEEAKCPNVGECFSQKTCTFMILGNLCTRSCAFCGVNHGIPLPPDPNEPQNLATAVRRLGIKYVVITSVTRDDLPDGGAGQFSAVVRSLSPLPVEVLIPDFGGSSTALNTVLDAKPLVLNHNIETVPRLYEKIRPQANYQRSLNILRAAKQRVYTKSGFMVGLGETREEVRAVINDLESAGCDIITIGQYLPPSRGHIPPERYVLPEEFEEYKSFGRMKIMAGPFVRSSYCAAEAVNV
jgi:lipoic acid synthetase